MSAKFPPTEEQQAVIAAMRTGKNLVVEAAAGAGKTSTLRLAAENIDGKILYLAFGGKAAADAKASFPRHVTCKTIHALAMGAVGRQYAHRLNGPRQSSIELARQLGIRDYIEIGGGVTLTPSAVARNAIGAVKRFCSSADAELGIQHLQPVGGMPARDEIKRWAAEAKALQASGRTDEARELVAMHRQAMDARYALANAILPHAQTIWADIADPNGYRVRFDHDHYLKLFQLTNPQLPYDVVMLDEAQDSNPVTAALVTSQRNSQLVAIGDGCQQMFGWRGAVDALATWPADLRLYLTQSWRFGQPIADEANKWLELVGTPMRVRGNPHLGSLVGDATTVPDVDAVLCRTNGTAIATVMTALQEGKRPALVGRVTDLISQCEAAADLKAGRRTDHPELFPFTTWGEVQDYSEEPEGKDLQTFVKLVDEHEPDVLIAALKHTVDEGKANLVVSTAHRSKGAEWKMVRIAGDFPPPKEEDAAVSREDAMIGYVAVTRAKLALDRTGLAWIDNYAKPASTTRAVA